MIVRHRRVLRRRNVPLTKQTVTGYLRWSLTQWCMSLSIMFNTYSFYNAKLIGLRSRNCSYVNCKIIFLYIYLQKEKDSSCWLSLLLLYGIELSFRCIQSLIFTQLGILPIIWYRGMWQKHLGHTFASFYIK